MRSRSTAGSIFMSAMQPFLNRLLDRSTLNQQEQNAILELRDRPSS
jgi:hypothetical protein